MTQKRIYSVAKLNAYIKNMFTQDILLSDICVSGELSNVKYHSSGHIYFTLKENDSAIKCVMFASSAKTVSFRLANGQAVVVSGRVAVYERDGTYQIYVQSIREEGLGALYERFLAMKQSMEEMGMFDACYKQPIPHFIKRLGVVTAPTGAVIQDIITVSKRRNPYIEIVLYPAIVQGEEAPESIVNGIRALEQLGVDTMIVGRGGGSIEDLWAFNDERVVQAIFECRTPVISAVGHGTDSTIADFVADRYAATPSEAAELAVDDVRSLLQQLFLQKKRFNKGMQQKIVQHKLRSETLRMQLEKTSPVTKLNEQKMNQLRMEELLQNSMDRKLMLTRHRFTLLLERFKAASPLMKLGGGYGYITKEDRPVKSATDVLTGDDILIRVSDGSIVAKVTKVNQE